MSSHEMVRMILWWTASYIGPFAAAVAACAVLERFLRCSEEVSGG